MTTAVIYTKTTCPYCVRAKEILAEQGVSVVEHVYGTGSFPSKEYLTEQLGVSVSSVPQIVLDGKHIGGCTELAAHYGVPVWKK